MNELKNILGCTLAIVLIGFNVYSGFKKDKMYYGNMWVVKKSTEPVGFWLWLVINLAVLIGASYFLYASIYRVVVFKG